MALQTKATLRKLHTHHNSVGRDLQRRIAKLKEEGKDPTEPQVPQITRGSPKGSDSPGPSNAVLRNRTLDSSSGTFDESFMILKEQVRKRATFVLILLSDLFRLLMT